MQLVTEWDSLTDYKGSAIYMKVIGVFVYSAGIFLLVTSVAKLISSFGHSAVLQNQDPLTGFPFQQLFRIAAGAEIAVALVCFFGKRRLFSAGLVAWLATTFLAYRIGLVLVGYHRPCACMGSLTDALHIPPQKVDMAMKFILAYLVFGSYASLFWLRGHKEKIASEKPLQTI